MTDSSLAPPEFSLPADDDPPARRIWSRGASTMLVVLIHLVFFAMLTFSVRMVQFGQPSSLETIFLLPSLEGRQTREAQRRAAMAAE